MELEYKLEDFEEIDPSVFNKEKDNNPENIDNTPIEETVNKPYQPQGDFSREEELLNYWLENDLLMINPEEDEITSVEQALEIDARRRSEVLENQIKDYLVESFPEDFKILAQAVINEGITDVKSIINLYKDFVQEEPAEMDESRAKQTVERHYKDKLSYDQDLLDITVETLIAKNKLIDTAKQIEKVEYSAQTERKKIELEKEVQRQTELKKQAEQQNQLYINNINQEIESRSWNKNIKKEVQNDYLSGRTIEKIKDLLQDPSTAPDIAMLVHRLYQKDQGGKINLNMEAIKELVSSQTVKELKDEQKRKAYNFRFGSLRKPSADEIDMSDYEY